MRRSASTKMRAGSLLLLLPPLLCLAAASPPPAAAAAAAAARLTVSADGSILAPGRADPVLLRGFTFMYTLKADQANVTDDDRQVTSLLPGTNFARLVMAHWHDAPTQAFGDCASADASLGFLTPACLQQFDDVVRWATTEAGMWVTITARASLAAGDGGAGATLWTNATLRQQMVQMWGFLAARYRNQDRIAGYEVLSEPRVDDATAIHAFHLDACGAVWRADPAALCFVGPGKFYDRTHLNSAYVLPSRQVVYAANMFDYVDGGNATGTGNGTGNATAVREALKRKLGMVSNFSTAFRVPVWIDQFGVRGDDPGGDAAQGTYLGELLQLLAEARFHWSYWIWRRQMAWACPGGYAVDCQLQNGSYTVVPLKLNALGKWLGTNPAPLPPYQPIVPPAPPAPEPLAQCEAHAKAMCADATGGYTGCHKCVWGHADDLKEEGCDFDGQHSAIVAAVCGAPPLQAILA